MEKTAILEQCNGGYCVHLGKSFQTHTFCVCKIWLRYSRLQSFPHPATSPPRQRCSRQAGCLVQLAASTRQCQVTGTYAAKVQKYYNDLFLNPLARKNPELILSKKLNDHQRPGRLQTPHYHQFLSASLTPSCKSFKRS